MSRETASIREAKYKEIAKEFYDSLDDTGKKEFNRWKEMLMTIKNLGEMGAEQVIICILNRVMQVVESKKGRESDIYDEWLKELFYD